MYRNSRYTLVSLFLFLCFVSLEAQCSMCRAVLDSEGSEEIAEGVNNGIVYLMAVPYLLVGFVGYFIVRYLRKEKKK